MPTRLAFTRTKNARRPLAQRGEVVAALTKAFGELQEAEKGNLGPLTEKARRYCGLSVTSLKVFLREEASPEERTSWGLPAEHRKSHFA